MKKITRQFLAPLLLLCVYCICCAGCGFGGLGKEDANKTEERGEKTASTYLGRDVDKIREHLSQFPTDYDQLKKWDILILTSDVTFHRGLYDDFISAVESGRQASLDAVSFTPKGDIISTYIQYNGKDFYYYQGSENESSYAGSGTYNQGTYQYMSLLKVPNRNFENIDFSGMTDGFIDFVLSDKKMSKYDDVENFSGDYLSLRISPLSSEKEAKSRAVY